LGWIGLDFGRAVLATAVRGRGFVLVLRVFAAAFRGLAFGFAALRVLAAALDLRAFGLGRALGRTLTRARPTLAARRPLLFGFCLVPFFALAAINATRKRRVG